MARIFPREPLHAFASRHARALVGAAIVVPSPLRGDDASGSIAIMFSLMFVALALSSAELLDLGRWLQARNKPPPPWTRP